MSQELSGVISYNYLLSKYLFLYFHMKLYIINVNHFTLYSGACLGMDQTLNAYVWNS